MRDGLTISFSEERVGNGLANLTAQLFITDIQTWNGSIFSCRAQGGENKNIPLCVTGKIVSVINTEWYILINKTRSCFISNSPVSGV